MADRSAPDVSYEELRRLMPEELKQALPAMRWHLDQLWALDLSVEPVELSSLTWVLSLPLWQSDGRRFQVSPDDVVRNPELYPAHMERAMRSDLAFPIHLVEHNGRWVILDGFHRLLKAVLVGQETLPAMRLTTEVLASISD